MRDQYGFSKVKGRRNPYVKRLEQPVTIHRDRDTAGLFKSMAQEAGMPYQSLTKRYLRDCAMHEWRLHLKWESWEGEARETTDLRGTAGYGAGGMIS